MNTSKMINTSKKLDTFFKVLQRILKISIIVVICVMTVLTIVNIVDPDAVIGRGFNMASIGPLTFELAEEHAPGNTTILVYSWTLMALITVCAIIAYHAFGLIRKILKPMTEGRPFEPTVADDIKKISFVCLALGIVQNIAGAIEVTSIIHNFNLEKLVVSENVRSITANYTFDFTFLILFFVLLLISHIFHYGAELQQQADETL